MDLSRWIMSIVGMVVISVIVDIVIPEGQTYKTIKGIFAFFTVLVIASPLPKMFNSEFDIKVFFDGKESRQEYSVELSDTIYQLRKDSIENAVQKALSQNGVEGALISINSKNNNSFVTVENISINLSKAVIKAVDDNIIKVEEIRKIVATAANVFLEVVTVYGTD